LKGKSKKKKKRKEKKGENLRTGVVGRVFYFVDNHEYFRIFPESHRVVTYSVLLYWGRKQKRKKNKVSKKFRGSRNFQTYHQC
jgi:hypothetical protein